ncbi:hypothetical protein PTTG_28759 [Puccinia triticina 1-1 BBBD Race 1]|uniref:Uncharacterized protein n=1 Tax=Puccinia triticina (isolate 1-1 / race 1 (BBBD)) TaxID=630390 RepID=A0A180G9F4_PUCT1|nr:hypothetical protein PTTG_28759 [Puccinia triticina 1-1 BBBD Race 1]
MAYRNKQPRQLNFSGLLVKHRIDNHILESQPGTIVENPHLPIYPQLGGGATAHSDTSLGNFETIVEDYPNETLETQGQRRRPETAGPSAKTDGQRSLAHSIISRRPKPNPLKQFSVDSAHSSILPSRSAADPSLTPSQSPTSQRIAFPPKPKRGYSAATVTFATPESHRDPETNGHSPRGPRSKLSYSEHDSNYLVITPTSFSSECTPPKSRSYFANHSPSATPTSARRTSLYSLSPQKHCQETSSTDPDIATSPTSYTTQRANSSASYGLQLDYSVASASTDLRAPTGSTSSLSLSSLSRTSTDHHLNLVSPALASPWPVPPSSAHSTSPFPSDLAKTEDTVRKISQRLSMLNGIDAVTLAAEAKSRYHAKSENGRSQDSTTGIRTSLSSVNYLLRCTSPQFTDQHPNPSNRDSYESSKTASSSKSHFDFDGNSSRSSIGMDRLSLGGVPLFTRASLSRDDKEEERPGSRKEQLRRVDDEELEPIPEAPDLESDAAYGIRITRSPTSMSGSYRRRLKPLILRSTPSNTISSRTRTYIHDSSVRNSQSSGSASPPQPSYETNSSLATNSDPWDSSQKSTDDVTLKDPDGTMGGQSVPESQEPAPSQRSDQQSDHVVENLNVPIQSNDASQESIIANPATKPPISGAVKQTTGQDKIDEIPVIQVLKPRSGTFGMGSSNTNLMVQNQPSATMGKESLVTLTIDEVPRIPTETQQNMPHVEHAKALSDNSFAPKNSFKSLSPIKTQMLPSARRRVSSHNSIQTGTCEDITLVSAPGKEHFPSSTATSHRKRCLSSLCMPKSSPRSADRGISAASYSAAKLAERKSSHSTTSSGPKTPDTIIITGPPAPNQVSTEEPSAQSSSAEQVQQFSGLAAAKLDPPARKSRLFLSLTRMQARDAKLLDLTGINSHQAHSSEDCRSLNEAQEQARLVQGKLKRISRPTLLHGEDERVALWGMISNGKLSPNSHK